MSSTLNVLDSFIYVYRNYPTLFSVSMIIFIFILFVLFMYYLNKNTVIKKVDDSRKEIIDFYERASYYTSLDLNQKQNKKRKKSYLRNWKGNK